MNKKNLLLIGLISLPLWAILTKFGIHTTHDYHIFRQQQFNLCANEGSIPCRWSPDAGFGYGEPMFNYYGQTPYLFGRMIGGLGFSTIESVKVLFILSIICSGISMFLFARKLYGERGGLLSAVAYMYAPYRAVDVWVRGALPEALSFVIFPIILLCLHQYILFSKKKYLPILSLSVFTLITTHNLSAFMFSPFVFILSIYWLMVSKKIQPLTGLITAALFSIALSLYYLLPVVIEKNLITLNLTTENYFSFTNHYVSIFQLFLSRYWGYGGSTWGPNDSLSFSIGHVHWIISVIVVVITILKLKKGKLSDALTTWVFFSLACISLFLTHGKSDPLWQNIPGLGYIQFPWRFLSMAVLMFSVVMGKLDLFKRKYIVIIVLLLIIFNGNYFKPDIWQQVTEQEFFSGESKTRQLASTVQDYWPSKASKLPIAPAPENPVVRYGEGDVLFTHKGAHKFKIEANIFSNSATIVLPVSNFPEWELSEKNKKIDLSSSTSLNLVTFNLPKGDHIIDLKFKNTPVRDLGNISSFLSLILFGTWCFRTFKYEK